ncbi:Uncharacterised protein [Mycobacterium tuberculosis]|uniref:Uncharacterized protein n=1 Tax=Mycobacterium tuberculosis TaxID=1773 RepID=A0A655AJ11_MYCTX|nr:Uncharacterised protein [Mycobacterium tuberculosis]
MTLVGLTTLPGGAELAAEVDAVGALRPSSSLLRPPLTSPNIRLNTEAKTSRATMRTAAPAPMPISRLRRRRV